MSAISSNTSASGSSGIGGAPDPYAELSSDEFMEILLTELTNQDPLEPNDSSKLLDQMSSLRSIQSDIELTDQLRSIVTQNEFASAGQLIGHQISGVSEDGRRVAGLVESVLKTPDGPILRLANGERVPFAQIDQIESLAGDDTSDAEVAG